MKKNKKFVLVIAIALLVAIGVGGLKLTEPAYALRMDVNPSIEIVSNRLNKVVEVNPLNDDARDMLKDYKIGNKNLKNTIEDLADLMVLKGYISGGKDNLVMITVEDENANQGVVNKLNKAIVAYLENKQIEATVVNQSIPKKDAEDKSSKEIVEKKMYKLGDDLNYELMADMTLRELIEYAESKNIAPQSLFNQVVRTVKNNSKDNGNKDKDSEVKELIGEAKAKEIALGLVNGEIVKFKLDDDDDDPEYEIKIIYNGHEYEIEINAYTGKVEEFEKDDIDEKDHKVNKKENNNKNGNKDNNNNKNGNKDNNNNKNGNKIFNSNRNNKSKTLISEAEAKEIALGLVNGKIVEFKLDDDDDDDAKYEIEIIANGYEYEIEIDAYTGKVLEFEKED